MIFVNFKTYPQGTGSNAVRLAQICEKVSREINVVIIPCVQAVDLSSVVKTVKISIWVQHLDPIEPGKNTGFISPFTVKNAGGKGTLVNHSEHPLSFEVLSKTIKLAKEFKLETLVLVPDIPMAVGIDELKPDYIGIEEPSLVGGKVAMVNQVEEKQKIIDFVKVIKKSRALVGAGINTPDDVVNSLKLGAGGILISSAVVLAQDQEKILRQMASAFKSG